MEDFKEKADQYKDQFASKAASVDQKGKFFTYSKPLTDAIDDGSLFTKYAGILYQVIGGLLLIFPLYLLYQGIFEDKIFDAPFKLVLLYAVFFAGLAASCWISFQILFNRKDQFKDLDRGKGYIATSIASNFLRTMGECLAVLVATAGTPMAILALIFDDAESFVQMVIGYAVEIFPLAGFGNDFANIFYFPIAAFCILVLTRFIAELINATADIAKNTKK